MISKIEYYPKRVIQIVSGSRSGSTLLKKLLAGSPDLTSLDGEEEPYFHYSGNGVWHGADSDRYETMDNPSLFRRLLMTELTIDQPWTWRLQLQYRGAKLARLLDRLPRDERTVGVDWLREMGVYGHYDGCRPEERLRFTEMAFEMPPFVLPEVRNDKKVGDTLLLKSPYNTYRPGLVESIFPRAQFTYVYLLRNPAATINGLIDGWQSPYGFHRGWLTADLDQRLKLSPTPTSLGYWKFDFPPGWADYHLIGSIEKRALAQWYSSYSIVADRMERVQRSWEDRHVVVRFEQLLNDVADQMERVCRVLGVTPPAVRSLPVAMATESPTPRRWRHRADVILPLLADEDAQRLIKRLDYTDTTRWI